MTSNGTLFWKRGKRRTIRAGDHGSLLVFEESNKLTDQALGHGTRLPEELLLLNVHRQYYSEMTSHP